MKNRGRRAPRGSIVPTRFGEEPIEIYLFRCGHGDTILVRLPDGRWGLIDCFLPEQFGVRREFFRFLQELNIRTFDFIFQTHPDYDHYHGMQEVIEHFLGRGEKIGYYIDTGLNARRTRELLHSRPGSAEYEVLQEKLEEWDESGYLKWRDLDAERIPFIPAGYRGQIEFIPIGPDPREKRRILTADLRRLAVKSTARPEANKLSLVVVLSVKIENRLLNVLLCADADTECIGHALDVWNRYAREKGIAAEFDAIKIPHHGSIKSHASGLSGMKRPGTGPETAAVCAGTRRALPDREVLREYLQNGWNVMATTTRATTSGPSLPMTLAHRGTPDDAEVIRHTIRLSWTPAAGLVAGPAAAKITVGDLSQYASGFK